MSAITDVALTADPPMDTMTRTVRLAIAALALGALSAGINACHRDRSPEAVREDSASVLALPPDSLLERVPLGAFAGVTHNRLASMIPNPYAGNTTAIKAGQQIMITMNCVACHGYDLRGGMGPDLTDTYWRYGGAPVEIFNSIYQGRPQGMPAWGKLLPRPAIWQIVAYIEAQGGAFPARLAESGLRGNLGDQDTTAGASLKGRQNDQ